MDSPPSKGRKRKILRWVLAGLVVLGLACWIGLKVLESSGWARLERRVKGIDAEIAGLNGTRPVLQGPGIPGDAWEDYEKACDLVGEGVDRMVLWKYLDRHPQADRSAVLQILAERGAALDWLSKGARRAEVRRRGFHEDEERSSEIDNGDCPRHRRLRILSYLASCRVRLLEEEGRVQEAIELLVDLAQFSGDLQREGTMLPTNLGYENYRRVWGEIFDCLESGKLPHEHLVRLEGTLELLDRWLPRYAVYRLGTLENYGQVILGGRETDFFSSSTHAITPSDYGGRAAFLSSRLALVASFNQSDAWAAREKDSDLGTYSQEKARAVEIMNEVSKSWNPVNRFFSLGMMGSGRGRRETLTQLRLLRVALHFRLTGEVLDLEDPFGTKLLTRERAGVVTIWSIGINGKDDGGIGEFAMPTRGPDIVLELKR